MELFIVYIILSAFGIAGTDAFDNVSTNIRIVLCAMCGWFLFPCMIMFTFGKFLNDVNHRY